MAVLYSISPENCPPAASTNFPQFLSVMAGGANRSALGFDSVVSERSRTLAFRMPTFTSPLTLKVTFSMAAITGNVQFRTQLEAITSGDALNTSTTTSYDTANSSGSISVPTTTFNTKDFIITLTNQDSVAAGDLVTITLDRDPTVSSNATGDCFVLLISLEDAS